MVLSEFGMSLAASLVKPGMQACLLLNARGYPFGAALKHALLFHPSLETTSRKGDWKNEYVNCLLLLPSVEPFIAFQQSQGLVNLHAS